MAVGEPKAGTVVGRRFLLEKRIGTGGFGSVWAARDQAGRDARVALKLLHEHHHADERIRVRFEREAEVLARLDHPSIAKCIAWDLDEEGGYLALEYVDGVTVARSMVRKVKRNGRFELQDVRRIFAELSAAVQFAHEMEVVHRDIKPANIMLLERAGTLYVKVLDFGVAKILAESGREHTSVGTLLGSLHYMGPEQAKGQTVDHRTDIFALGSVLFEMLTLRRAWLRNRAGEPIQAGAPVKNGDAENNDLALIMRLINAPRPVPTQWRPDLPPAIDAVIAKALAVDPEHRYPSAEAFAEAVDDALAPRRAATPALSTTADLPAVAAPKVRERYPSPTPAPAISQSVERGPEPGHTFETSRPEALMRDAAALWNRVDEALVREAEAAPPESPPKRSRRAPMIITIAIAVSLAAAGVIAYQAFFSPPAVKTAPAPAPGRLIDDL